MNVSFSMVFPSLMDVISMLISMSCLFLRLQAYIIYYYVTLSLTIEIFHCTTYPTAKIARCFVIGCSERSGRDKNILFNRIIIKLDDNTLE